MQRLGLLVRTFCILVVAALVGAAALSAISFMAQSVFGLEWVSATVVFLAVAVLVWVFPALSRPLPLRSKLHGSIWIDAQPEVVWQHLNPTPGQPHYLHNIIEVLSVEGAPDRLDLRMAKTPDQVHPEFVQVIVKRAAPHSLQLRYLNAHLFPGFGGDLTLTEYSVTARDGGTQVTVSESFGRMRLSLLVMPLFVHPCSDALLALKAKVEGTRDTSWLNNNLPDMRLSG